MPTLPKASVTLSNATIGYDSHPALHHVTTRFQAGSLTAIVGPNGAGKSTLLKAIVGLIRPIGGTVSVEGCAPRAIAYLPQQAEIDRSFPLPVFDFVAMGLWRGRGPFAAFRRADDTAIAEAIAAVGLGGFERRSLATLSGGQLQRVLFARLSLQNAPLILLDEPFSAIDQGTQADLMRLIRRWQAEGRTVIAVLHDLDLVRRDFPNTLLVARRVLADGPTATVLTARNLTAAAGMTEAWDETAPVCDMDGAA